MSRRTISHQRRCLCGNGARVCQYLGNEQSFQLLSHTIHWPRQILPVGLSSQIQNGSRLACSPIRLSAPSAFQVAEVCPMRPTARPLSMTTSTLKIPMVSQTPTRCCRSSQLSTHSTNSRVPSSHSTLFVTFSVESRNSSFFVNRPIYPVCLSSRWPPLVSLLPRWPFRPALPP